MDPTNCSVLSLCRNNVTRIPRDRVVGIVVNFGSGNYRHPFIEQMSERANHACLGLTALTEKHNVMSSEKRILKLWHHGLFVSHHTFKQRKIVGDVVNCILTKFFLHRNGLPSRSLQGSQRGGQGSRHSRNFAHAVRVPFPHPNVPIDSCPSVRDSPIQKMGPCSFEQGPISVIGVIREQGPCGSQTLPCGSPCA